MRRSIRLSIFRIANLAPGATPTPRSSLNIAIVSTRLPSRTSERSTKSLSRTISFLYMNLLMVYYTMVFILTDADGITEIIDFGYPQNSEIDTLKTYITTESVMSTNLAAVISFLPIYYNF